VNNQFFDWGGDQKSILRIPLEIDQVRKKENIEQFEVEDIVINHKNNRPIKGKVIIEGSIGLLNEGDEDIYIGLLNLTREQCYLNGTGKEQNSPKIYFKFADLLRRIGWPHQRYSYMRTREVLNKLQRYNIIWTKTFYDPTKGAFGKMKIGLISDIFYTNEDEEYGKMGSYGYFRWAPTFWEKAAGDLRFLNMEIYRQIKNSKARKLYRYIDYMKGGDGKEEHTFWNDLRVLAHSRLGLSENLKPYHLKKQLTKYAKELVKIGYLKDVENTEEWFKEYRNFEGKKSFKFQVTTTKLLLNEQIELNLNVKSAHEDIEKANKLVCYFQAQSNYIEGYSPTQKEINHALELIEKCEEDVSKAKWIIDYALNEAPKTKFNIQVFGGIMQYIPKALKAYDVEKYKKEVNKKKMVDDYEQKKKEYFAWRKKTKDQKVQDRLVFWVEGEKNFRDITQEEIDQKREEIGKNIPTPEEYQKKLFGKVVFPIEKK
jgi:hypothetical protein